MLLRPLTSLFVATALLLPGSAFAISITANQVAVGSTIGTTGITSTIQAAGAVGGGNLAAIMAAAVAQWQQQYTEAFTLTINYGWGAIGTAGLNAFQKLESQGGGREITGSIVFDSSSPPVFFLDSTPNDSSEYTTFTPTTQVFTGNAGAINVGRVYTGGTGFAAGNVDVLTLALRELGAALGLSTGNTAYNTEVADSKVDLTAPRAFPGAQIPILAPVAGSTDGRLNVTGSTALETADASIALGTRRLASDADILAIGQVSQFVPEPTTWLLLSSGLVLLLAGRRRLGSRT